MKKNNLFKISLLLLMSNLSNIYSNTDEYMPTQLIEAEKQAKKYNNYPGVKACRDGVRARDFDGNAKLLTSFDDIKNLEKTPGKTLVNVQLDTDQEKAAWIFGYNQNMTGVIENGLSYTYDNGWDTGVMFNLPADENFGGEWTNKNYLGPIEVCVYGHKIDWAFDAPQSKNGNLKFFKSSGASDSQGNGGKNDIIGADAVFGERFSERKRGAYGRRNTLQQFLNSKDKIQNSACRCTGFTDSEPLTIDQDTGLLK